MLDETRQQNMVETKDIYRQTFSNTTSFKRTLGQTLELPRGSHSTL